MYSLLQPALTLDPPATLEGVVAHSSNSLIVDLKISYYSLATKYVVTAGDWRTCWETRQSARGDRRHLGRRGDLHHGVGTNYDCLPDIDWIEVQEGDFLDSERLEKHTLHTFYNGLLPEFPYPVPPLHR